MTRSVCAIAALVGSVFGGSIVNAADVPGGKGRQNLSVSQSATPVMQAAEPATRGSALIAGQTVDPTHAMGTSLAPSTQEQQPPRIVVHTGVSPTSAADNRVQMGDIQISMPRWTMEPASQPAAKSERPSGAAIVVPSNTLGPGEPLWRINERRDAERRAAEANAEFAEARAAQASRDVGHDSRLGYIGGAYFPRVWTGGFGYGGARNRHDGLRGPVTTTVTRSDLQGSTAQQAWSDAASPRLNGTTDARDAIVSQFGRDATPPIVRIQNDIDRAHTNASKEQLPK